MFKLTLFTQHFLQFCADGFQISTFWSNLILTFLNFDIVQNIELSVFDIAKKSHDTCTIQKYFDFHSKKLFSSSLLFICAYEKTINQPFQKLVQFLNISFLHQQLYTSMHFSFQDFGVYRKVLLCAQFPILSAPDPPLTPSPAPTPTTPGMPPFIGIHGNQLLRGRTTSNASSPVGTCTV